jgi:hypothetical protein
VISCATVLQSCADVVYRRLGDTAVVVHLGTNEIFELNDTGARIWELTGEGRPADAVIDALCAEFDVPPATARAEYDELIAILLQRQLLQLT